MNGAHDMGGADGFGPVVPEPDEPVFHAEWEARVLALTLAMGLTGEWSTDASRFARENRPPAEAIELEYPLRVERWELRSESGGKGAHNGGDGVVRELRVLEDCRLSVLAERRRHAPRGRDGGEDGASGRTVVNGEEQPPKLTRQLRAGDVVRVETPGGGGYGAP